MNSLESKVTDLALSRKLAAAFKGIKPPESEFYWLEWRDNTKGTEGWKLEHDPGLNKISDLDGIYPAYLSDELLEGMPQKVEKDWLVIKKLGKSFWTVQYGDRPWEESIVLSYACARMTLWLIDNGYYE